MLESTGTSLVLMGEDTEVHYMNREMLKMLGLGEGVEQGRLFFSSFVGPEDLELLQAVVERLSRRMDFSWEEVLAIFEREPQLAEINASVNHKSGFDIDDRVK
uniref:PAS domain-containing protein n=1 Tax=Anaerolinea thermolimosa TaxID=229919 RepID=A0A7C4PNN6_9CHLR